MKYLRAQLNASQAVTKQFQGRDHLVIPAVLLREMVIHGVKGYPNGPELVPWESIESSADLWEGVPVTVDHPEQSARNRQVQDAQAIGHVFDVQAKKPKLQANLWIDIAKAEQSETGQMILDKAGNGEMIELSTGYGGKAITERGTFNGQDYFGIQTNLFPDHLAVFTDGIGACSVHDGCGANRLNAEGEILMNLLSTARTPTFSGTSEAEWNRPTFQDLKEAFDWPEDANSVASLTADEKRQAASLSLLGSTDADTFDELTFFPVVEPGGRLNRNALQSVIGGRGSQADISRQALNSAQGIARNLLREEFDMEFNENEKKTLMDVLMSIKNALTPGGTMSTQEKTREELVKALVTNEHVDLSEDDLQNEEKYSLCALQALNAAYSFEKKEEKGNEQHESREDLTETINTAISAAIENNETFRKVTDFMENQQSKQEQEKEQLVEKLIANQSTSVPKEELLQSPMSVLKDMDKRVNYGVYGNYQPQDDEKFTAEDRQNRHQREGAEA